MTILLRDTPQALSERHPDLSPEEHHERIITAVHEASHLVTGLALRTGMILPGGYIRVPRRRSPWHNGLDGKVVVDAFLWEQVIVSFASLPAAQISGDPTPKVSCWVDHQQAREESDSLARSANIGHLSLEIRRELLVQAINLVVKHWSVIDLVATDMLMAALKSGEIQPRKMCVVIDNAKRALSKRKFKRDVMFPVGNQFQRTLTDWRDRPSVITNDPGNVINEGYPHTCYW